MTAWCAPDPCPRPGTTSANSGSQLEVTHHGPAGTAGTARELAFAAAGARTAAGDEVRGEVHAADALIWRRVCKRMPATRKGRADAAGGPRRRGSLSGHGLARMLAGRARARAHPPRVRHPAGAGVPRQRLACGDPGD